MSDEIAMVLSPLAHSVVNKSQDFQIEEALTHLSSDERDAIRLIVQDGKATHAAEALGVTVTTINNWKHRGLSKLKKLTDLEALTSGANPAIS